MFFYLLCGSDKKIRTFKVNKPQKTKNKENKKLAGPRWQPSCLLGCWYMLKSSAVFNRRNINTALCGNAHTSTRHLPWSCWCAAVWHWARTPGPRAPGSSGSPVVVRLGSVQRFQMSVLKRMTDRLKQKKQLPALFKPERALSLTWERETETETDRDRQRLREFEETKAN